MSRSGPAIGPVRVPMRRPSTTIVSSASYIREMTARASGIARLKGRIVNCVVLHILNRVDAVGKCYMIPWGIRCEPVTTILWGVQRDPCDIAYSAITGRARGDRGTWKVDEDTTDEAPTGMADATATTREVATWSARFQTRQDPWCC